MLHLQPQPVESAESRRQPYAEAVSRLASIRHALRLVDDFGGGPASDLGDDEAIAERWDDAGAARRALFDRRSAQVVGSTAAGLEALLAERASGREPHQEAGRALVDEIRRDLAQASRTILR